MIHDGAGTLAIWFAILATGFSLATQALTLGDGTAAVAAGLARGEPPRPVERAACRHVRDRGDRRAGCSSPPLVETYVTPGLIRALVAA